MPRGQGGTTQSSQVGALVDDAFVPILTRQYPDIRIVGRGIATLEVISNIDLLQAVVNVSEVHGGEQHAFLELEPVLCDLRDMKQFQVSTVLLLMVQQVSIWVYFGKDRKCLGEDACRNKELHAWSISRVLKLNKTWLLGVGQTETPQAAMMSMRYNDLR